MAVNEYRVGRISAPICQRDQQVMPKTNKETPTRLAQLEFRFNMQEATISACPTQE